jgi:hypothetical protein
VTIAGIAFDIDGPAWLAPHVNALGPFLHATPFTRCIPLRIAPFHAAGETSVPVGGSVVYRRPELVFGTDAGGLWARIDPSVGSFEAALQLGLEAALLFEGGLVVHASAGVIDGGAWLMPGVSGTGKSTAARAAGFDTVLCDEMCVVRCVNGEVQVAGTPFWSADRPLPLCSAQAPLAVLAQLVQADTVEVASLATADAAAYLLRGVTLYRQTPEARAAAFETACVIAEAARCVTLRFPKEGPWLTAAVAGVSAASSPKPWRRPSP